MNEPEYKILRKEDSSRGVPPSEKTKLAPGSILDFYDRSVFNIYVKLKIEEEQEKIQKKITLGKL